MDHSYTTRHEGNLKILWMSPLITRTYYSFSFSTQNLLRKEMRIDDLVNASSMFYSFNALSNSTIPVRRSQGHLQLTHSHILVIPNLLENIALLLCRSMCRRCKRRMHQAHSFSIKLKIELRLSSAKASACHAIMPSQD